MVGPSAKSKKLKLDIYTHLLALRYHGLPLNSQRSLQMSQLLEVLKQTLRQNDWDTDGLFENPYHRNQRLQFQLICTELRLPGQIRPPCWIQVSKSQSSTWNKITLYARNACKGCRVTSNVLRYFKPLYFSWSSPTFSGSLIISKLLKTVPMFTKPFSLAIIKR